MMGDQPVYKKDWVLTGPAFDKLLACLDPDLNEAGRKLLDIRRRLQKFFECNRCPDPDELVDMTIDRGARRIDEGVEVRELPSYLTQIARFVLKEHWASPQNKMDEIDEEGSGSLLVAPTVDDARNEKEEQEERLECLEKCSGKLVPVERQRVIDYYYEQGRAKIDKRKRMAGDLRITLGNLRVRMHRTRERLEECILDCLSNKKRI
jgi:DNA-directed RNA polymerase specialized sigma24 family protein